MIIRPIDWMRSPLRRCLLYLSVAVAFLAYTSYEQDSVIGPLLEAVEILLRSNRPLLP